MLLVEDPTICGRHVQAYDELHLLLLEPTQDSGGSITLTSRIMHPLRNLLRSIVCVLFVRISLNFVSPASLNINAIPEATLSLQVW